MPGVLEVEMKLSFVYLPVEDIKEALKLYRDTLGFEEGWRASDLTVGLKMPGTEVLLMLDQDTPAPDKPGPFFQVESVDEYDRLCAIVAAAPGRPRRAAGPHRPRRPALPDAGRG